ncbi:unnamed protein product [Scytosiphon promiscuus]
MSISQVIAAIAIICTLLLDQATVAVACTSICPCPAVLYTVCQYVQGVATPAPTTVVRAVVTSSSIQSSINEEVNIFTADVTTVYSGDDVDDVSFINGGNRGCCVELTIGEEYLLSLYPAVPDPFASTDMSGLLTVGSCDLVMLWTDVFPGEVAALEAGCEANGCNILCDATQECVQYLKNDEYYCSDTCDDPDSCEDGKECTTRPRSWCRDSGYEGCPEKRKCR